MVFYEWYPLLHISASTLTNPCVHTLRSVRLPMLRIGTPDYWKPLKRQCGSGFLVDFCFLDNLLPTIPCPCLRDSGPSLRKHPLELTAPKATDSIVCILAASMDPMTPFLYSRALPARVQNFICLTPTDTNCVSESGRNSTTNIRSR